MGHVQDRWRDPARKGRGKRWQARVRGDDGLEHSRAFDRKVDAQRWVADMEVSKARGAFLDVRGGSVRFKPYAEGYLAVTRMRPQTRASVESNLRIHVYPVIGGLALNAIRPSHIDDITSGIAAASTATSLLRYLSPFFSAAVRDRLIAHNPVADARKPKVVKERIVPLTTAEVAELVTLTREDLQSMVVACAGLGLRLGEASGLCLSQVDFLHRRVYVDRQWTRMGWGPPKTNTSVRTIPLPAFVADALTAHVEARGVGDQGVIWCGQRGQPLAPTTIRQAAVLRWAAAGYTATMHDLRHHYASILIAAGESPVVVARRLGHANVSITLNTYAGMWPDDDVRTLDILDRGWVGPSVVRERDQPTPIRRDA